MMQQHIGRAQRVGACVIPDHAVPAVDSLDRIALEPAIEIVAGRIGEEIEQLALQIEAEPAQPVGDTAGLDQLGDRRERMAFDDVRRRLERKRAQHIRDRFEPRLVGIEPFGIARGKLRHLLVGAPTAHFEIAPVIERQKIRDAALDDAQAMLGKPQVGDHLGIEQRDRVGGDRVAEAGMKFFRHRRAADDVAPLEHHHLQPGHRQIGGADETVMSAANDDSIVCLFCHDAGLSSVLRKTGFHFFLASL